MDDALRRIGGHAQDEDASLPTGLAVLLAFADPDHDPSVPTSWPTSHAYYGVRPDGRLLVEGWDLHRMTVGDLRRAWESGYVTGGWDQIVVLDPEGLGGPADLVSPFVDFLADVGFELVVGAAAYQAQQAKIRIEQWREDRRARAIIDSWHEHGIDGPWTLSQWVDRKVSWSAFEVSTRLGISQVQADSLLAALGYEYSKRLGAWTVGTSQAAINRRRKWDEGESKEWRRPRNR
ncbi:MAG: hypothetical protein WKF82_05235 [Nocardioidaceae bacterium]